MTFASWLPLGTLVIVTTAIVPATTTAQDKSAAFGFKEWKLMSDYRPIDENRRFDCYPLVDECLGEKRCSVYKEETIAEATVSSLNLYSLEGKLQSIHIDFKEIDYRTVLEAMEVKYGKPAEVFSEIVTNRMGAKFENSTHVWRKSGVRIRLVRYSYDLDESSVTIETDHYFDHYIKCRKSTPHEKAKDL